MRKHSDEVMKFDDRSERRGNSFVRRSHIRALLAQFNFTPHSSFSKRILVTFSISSQPLKIEDVKKYYKRLMPARESGDRT